MPRRKSNSHTANRRLRVDTQQRQFVVSPLKNRLSDNNETKVELNGLGERKLSTEGFNKLSGPDRYLHKKFKKVATLEETEIVPPSQEHDEGAGRAVGQEQQGGGGGRNQCPHCRLVCAKPSVLQKHVRAHTNERPYPCLPCGIAFKTKSNLYKHCRSRAHTLKVDETDGVRASPLTAYTSSEDDDVDSAEGSRPPIVLEPAPQQPSDNNNRIYKPKFHKFTLYSATEEAPPTPPPQELLHAHINRLISENKAIVGEPQVKRHIARKVPSPSPPLQPNLQADADRWEGTKETSRLAFALLRPPSPQPLNLSTTKPFDNPEGSIIKDILLKARSASQYACPRCRSVFGTLECLEFHSCLKRSRSGEPDSPPVWRVPHLPEPLRLHKKPPMKVRKLSLDEPRSPLKTGVHLFGGKVHILDNASGETRTLRIEPGGKQDTPPAASYSIESSDLGPPQAVIKIKEPQVLTISKTGLHSVGNTIVQRQRSVSPKSSIAGLGGGRCYSDLTTIPNLPPALNPLTSITAFNPLTLPTTMALGAPLSPSAGGFLSSGTSGGVVTIVHGGKSIRHVPGIPGPVTPTPILPQAKKPVIVLPEKTVIVKSGSQTLQERPRSLELEEVPVKRSRPASEDIVVKVPQPPQQPKKELSIAVGLTTSDTTRDSASTSPSTPSSSSSEAPQDKKFLRPTSLPLRPGTYTPKRHVSLLPQASLISPETPRPRKAYVQLYLNGHAYTYLGLKCSTRMFFCTLNKPQPIYVPLSPEHKKVSMYSNWKVCSESNPNPFGLNPGLAMGHYDSRNRPACYTVANSNRQDVVTHSSYLRRRNHNKQTNQRSQTTAANTPADSTGDKSESEKSEMGSSVIVDGGNNYPRRVKVCDGGFESNEDYTYVRGRGRGRYVCEECGIRCKKPSMLKKHIRTHTDLRPYNCKHCAFSFKTKGNLTKHMKSKAHYKKCVELDVPPDMMGIDDDANNMPDEDSSSQNAQDLFRDGGGSGGVPDSEEETEDDDDDDDDEDDDTEDEEEGKIHLAARSLISLSEVAPQIVRRQFASAGLDSGRPSTYPYTLSAVQPSTPVTSTREPSFDIGVATSPMVAERQRHSDASVVSTLATLSSMTRHQRPFGSTDGSPVKLLHHTTDMSVLTAKLSDISVVTPLAGSTPQTLDLGRPIDLSNKATAGVRTPVITAVSGQASLLATICSTTERLPSLVGVTTPTEIAPTDTHLLHRYLKERAARESLIKRQQCCPPSQDPGPTTPTLLPSPQVGLLDNMTVSSPSSGISSGSGGGVSSPDVPEDNQLLHRYLKDRSARESTLVKRAEPTKPEDTIETSSASLEIICGTSPTGVSHPQVNSPRETTAPKIPSPTESADSGVSQVNANAKESALGILALTTSDAKKSAALQSQRPSSPNKKLKAEFMPPSSGPSPSYVSIMEDGRSMCSICNKVFNKPSQLRLHVNIHYFERPFRCESCAVSFRTKGHLQKHQRSVSHLNKVNMNSTFGTPTTSNPRPFKCDDCKIAFRIHGHLAKHLRSKMHIMKLECLGKLPFGTYAELERSGTNMNDIDTTDCENSLESLQKLAQKLYEKDPSKLGQWTPIESASGSLLNCPGNGGGGGTSGCDSEDEDDFHDLAPRLGRFEDGYNHHHQEDGVR